jgi:hypothetical protein
MKIKLVFMLGIIAISFSVLFSQNVPFIPESRLVNWKNAGLLPQTPLRADNLINITDYAGSDYDKIVNAVSDANNLPGTTIIYLPAGTYSINSTISITNIKDGGIIFQGDGSESTILVFDGLSANDNCFYVHGSYSSNNMTVTQNISKGSKTIIGSFSNLSAGDWIHLCEENFDDHYSETGYVGQITQLESGGTSSLIIKDDASKSYIFK